MGKHVKKKNRSVRLPLRKEEPAENYVADTWLDAAQREGELDDLRLDDVLSLTDDLFLGESLSLSDDRVEETILEPEEDLPVEEEFTPAEEPVVEAPEEPVVEAPEEPVIEAPEEPVIEAPEEPVIEAPEEPVIEAPEEPVIEAPEEPVVEAPEEPVIEAPEEPVIEAPEEPVAETPEELFQGETEDLLSPEAPEALDEEAHDIALAKQNEEAVFAQMFSSRQEANVPAQPQRKKKPRPGASRSGSSRKKKKRRAKKFKKGLKTYVIIMLCLIVAICAALWVLLARYQRGVDERLEAERLAAEQAAAERAEAEAIRRAPQQAFEAWKASIDTNTWTDMWFSTHPLELESRELVYDFMDRHFSAAVPYKAEEYTDEAPVYVLREGDETLSRIYLSGAGKDWYVSQVDLLMTGDKSASVSAITGSKIFCNGIELGDEYITDSAVNFSYGPLSNQLVNPVSMLTYTVDGLLAEPTMTVEPPEGCNLVKTEDGNFLMCMSQADGKPLADSAVTFVRAYLYYFMSGLSNTYGNLAYALGFLTPGTQAYKDLQDTLNGVVWNTAYANIDTTNTTASDVVIWADNCRSVDVTYSAKCTLNGQPIDYADATMRIYFLKGNNGNFYISNYETL